jgi:hypothetical protein
MDMDSDKQRLMVSTASCSIYILTWDLNTLSFSCSQCIDLHDSIKGVSHLKWIREDRACFLVTWNGSVLVYHVRKNCLLFELPILSKSSCTSIDVISDEFKKPLQCLCGYENGTFSLWSLFN